MPTLEKRGLNLGVEIIDSQHQGFFRLVEELMARTESGDDRCALESAIDHMVDYVDIHFDTEKEMMTECHYPAFEAHQKEHAYFVQKLMDFSSDFRENKGDLDLDVLVFLSEWFSNHILKTDAKLAAYLQNVTPV